MSDQQRIGFPPNALSEDAVKLDVLFCVPSKFAIVNKPAGILLDSYLGAPDRKSAMLAMRETPDKPEFKRLGIKSPYVVNQVDFEMSGAAIIAFDKDVAASFRNALWSNLVKCEYLLLTKAAFGVDDVFTVDLPILMNEERPVWTVSHRFGKKARTDFEAVETSNAYQLWRARASAVRPHQIRLHAAEGKLKIVGENVYGHIPPIYMSDLKEVRYKLPFGEEERPLYEFPCVHLTSVSFDGTTVGIPELGKVSVAASPAKGLSTCLKRLGFSKAK